MSLVELLEIHLSDIGLFKDFITLVACTASFATIVWFGVINLFIDFITRLCGRIKRHFYLKRNQESVWNTIQAVRLVNQLYENDVLLKVGLTSKQADLIEDALIYYAIKKKVHRS